MNATGKRGVPSPPLSTPGGYREVLSIAIPLILSTSSMSLMLVVDRIFLSWYSADALAASLPAGATAWIFLSLFVGAAGYINTFVSQYDGAAQPHRIGAAVWQGIYFSLLASLFCLGFSLLGRPIFVLAAHPPQVLDYEVICFQVLVAGGGTTVLATALSAFYSGRGKTWVVLGVNLFGVLLNGVLDYLMIFGKAGFPEWGIFGASLASVIAPAGMAVLYILLIFTPRNRDLYRTAEAWRFETGLFKRVLRFGFPSGLQNTMDVAAFTLFVLLIGRIGEVELAASNIAFAINHLVYMPMVGLALGTSVLVGRYQGADSPDLAAKSTWSSLWLTSAYMVLFSLVLALWPERLVEWFNPGGQGDRFGEVMELTCQLLYFVAGYSVIQGANIVFSSALKGAGDTRFVFLTALVVAFLALVVPTYVACVIYDQGILLAWWFLSFWLFILAAVYGLRFLGGKWRTMKVIEQAPAPNAALQEGPVVEF